MTEPESPLQQQLAPYVEELAEEKELRRRKARAEIRRDIEAQREERRQRSAQDRASNYSSAVTIRFGEREFAYRRSAYCKVCNSQYVGEIDKSFMHGRTAAWIARNLPDDADISQQNLYAHRRKHLDAWQMDHLDVIEAVAIERGYDVENGVESLVNEVSFARQVVQIAQEKLMSGEIQPTLSDAMNAAKFLSTVGSEGASALDQQAYAATMMRYFELARSTMSTDDFTLFIERVRADPMLAALAGRGSEPRAIEAEAID